jgi:hypothetical protein
VFLEVDVNKFKRFKARDLQKTRIRNTWIINFFDPLIRSLFRFLNEFDWLKNFVKIGTERNRTEMNRATIYFIWPYLNKNY